MLTRTIGDLAARAGIGLAAGLAGTAAMTVSSTIEAKLQGRGPSPAPAQAAGKLLGVRPRSEAEQSRFSNVVHWAYGTSWGAVRGLLAALGLPPAAASAAHLALIWSTEQVMLPALGVSPPITEWDAKTIAVDGVHHVVYAAATGAAYELLAR